MALSTRFHLLHSRQPRRLIRREGLLIKAFGYSGVTFALLQRFQDPARIGMARPGMAENNGAEQK